MDVPEEWGSAWNNPSYTAWGVLEKSLYVNVPWPIFSLSSQQTYISYEVYFTFPPKKTAATYHPVHNKIVWLVSH